jgi:hypothetical protein
MTAVTFDSIDAAASAGFWAAVLDARVADGATSDAASVEPAEGLPLYFTRVPESKIAKNRLHLDITVDDLDREVDGRRRAGGDRARATRRPDRLGRHARPGRQRVLPRHRMKPRMGSLATATMVHRG